jgi:hypothetical protein
MKIERINFVEIKNENTLIPIEYGLTLGYKDVWVHEENPTELYIEIYNDDDLEIAGLKGKECLLTIEHCREVFEHRGFFDRFVDRTGNRVAFDFHLKK